MCKEANMEFYTKHAKLILPKYMSEALDSFFHKCRSLNQMHQKIDKIKNSGGGELHPDFFGLNVGVETNEHHIEPLGQGGDDAAYNIVTMPVLPHRWLHDIFQALIPAAQHIFLNEIFKRRELDGKELHDLRNKLENIN